MGGLSALAALLAAVACGVALAPRPGFARLRAVNRVRRATGRGLSQPPVRANGVSAGRRAVAALLAGVAAVAITGGAGGWFAGLAVGVIAWVGLGRL